MKKEHFCKPLTPNLRADILWAINNMENELKTCENLKERTGINESSTN